MPSAERLRASRYDRAGVGFKGLHKPAPPLTEIADLHPESPQGRCQANRHPWLVAQKPRERLKQIAMFGIQPLGPRALGGLLQHRLCAFRQRQVVQRVASACHLNFTGSR
jgi:hypothetical protein